MYKKHGNFQVYLAELASDIIGFMSLKKTFLYVYVKTVSENPKVNTMVPEIRRGRNVLQ